MVPAMSSHHLVSACFGLVALGCGTPSSGDTPTDAALADTGSPDCAAARQALEASMISTLEAAAVDVSITTQPDFTWMMEATDGRRFVYSHGASSPSTSYESASTSKWVTAVVLLELVDRGVLALDTDVSSELAFWTTPGVTLRDLLSFTSGYSDEPLCLNLGGADFAACVAKIYADNVAAAPAPGTVFHYSGTHLQIAGLMAMRATGAASWTEVFDAWKARTGLFATSVYSLPSTTNPRLAGGMQWRTDEYFAFLRALAAGELLSPALQAAMLADQRGAATVASSPTLTGIGQDWAYGLGNWLECQTATTAGSFDCGAGHRNSSPGAYGAYPVIDLDHGYIGLLARQGGLGTFPEGHALVQTIAEDAARWAAPCAP